MKKLEWSTVQRKVDDLMPLDINPRKITEEKRYRMEYTEQFLKQVSSLGTLGYSLNKCINILDVADADIEVFTTDFDITNSKVAKAYQKGVDKAAYAIDVKLFDLATKEGDLKALEMFEARKAEERERESARKNQICKK